MPDKETCHFWLGRFPSKKRVVAYFREVRGDSDEPLSEFAWDQRVMWYDHDFLEFGFNAKASSIKQLVNGYSYHEEYEDELTRRAEGAGVGKANMFAFITKDKIKRPRSVETEEYSLQYMGTISYRI